MPNLHVYGDSYVESPMPDYLRLVKSGEQPGPWYYEVGKGLDVDEMYVHGVMGFSNESIYDKWKANLHQIKPGDYVIVVMTEVNRRWFFPEYPEFSNLALKGKEHFFKKEEVVAINQYLKYLDNPSVGPIMADTISQTIGFNCMQIGVEHALIIPGFAAVEPYTYSPYTKNVGNLGLPCFAEFISDKVYQGCMANTESVDARLNHLSWVNHEVMARKALASIKLGKDLDLTTGFETNIFTKPEQFTDLNKEVRQYWDAAYDPGTGKRILEKERNKGLQYDKIVV